MLANSFKWIMGWRPAWPWQVWLLSVAPLAIYVSLLIGTGTFLQFYTSSALYNQAPSIYAAAHEEGFARFPDPIGWILNSLDLPYLVIGAVAAMAALRASTLRGAALIGALAIFLGLVVLDLYFYMVYATSSSISASMISNVAGSVMMLLAIFVALCVRDTITSSISHETIAKTIFAITLIVSGIALSFCIYLILYFFYQPTPVRLELTARAPASLMTFKTNEEVSSASEEGSPSRLGREGTDSEALNESFELIPKETGVRTVQISSIGRNLITAWRRPRGDEIFNVEIGAFLDCFRPSMDHIRNLAETRVFSGVSSLQISFPHILAEAVFDRADPRTRFSFRTSEGSMFWLERPERNARGLNLNAMVLRESDVLTATSTSSVEFFISGYLMDARPGSEASTRGRARSTEGTIDVATSSGALRLVAGGQANLQSRRRPNCRPLNLTENAANGRAIEIHRGPVQAVALGIFVRIERGDGDQQFVPDTIGDLSFRGARGSIDFKGISLDGFDRSLGKLKSAIISGSISRLAVDGRPTDVRPNSTVYFRGDLSGQLMRSGEFSFEGRAPQLWLDNRRLNPTRWERLTEAFQIFFLGALGSVLLFTGTMLRSTLLRLAKDDPLVL